MTSPPPLPPPPPLPDPSSGNPPRAVPSPPPLPPPPDPASVAPVGASGTEAPPDKDVMTAFLLTFFFGPLGLFYVTTPVIAIIVNVVAIILVAITIFIAYFFIWPISVICGVVMATNQHKLYEEWRMRTMMGR